MNEEIIAAIKAYKTAQKEWEEGRHKIARMEQAIIDQKDLLHVLTRTANDRRLKMIEAIEETKDDEPTMDGGPHCYCESQGEDCCEDEDEENE